VRHFPQPLTVVVRLDPARPGPADAESIQRLALWTGDAADDQWVRRPSQMDAAAGTLTAMVDHFSSFAASDEDPFAVLLPALNNFNTDLFSGGVTSVRGHTV